MYEDYRILNRNSLQFRIKCSIFPFKKNIKKKKKLFLTLNCFICGIFKNIRQQLIKLIFLQSLTYLFHSVKHSSQSNRGCLYRARDLSRTVINFKTFGLHRRFFCFYKGFNYGPCSKSSIVINVFNQFPIVGRPFSATKHLKNVSI